MNVFFLSRKYFMFLCVIDISLRVSVINGDIAM